MLNNWLACKVDLGQEKQNENGRLHGREEGVKDLAWSVVLGRLLWGAIAIDLVEAGQNYWA